MKEMERVVKGTFKLAVSLSSRHIQKSDLDKVDAIAVIAKETIKMATAAAIYPKELNSVVENSIAHNVYQYKVITREGKDYLKEIEKYDVDTREQIFDKGNPFVENNVDKSAQVSQSTQINAPSIDIK